MLFSMTISTEKDTCFEFLLHTLPTPTSYPLPSRVLLVRVFMMYVKCSVVLVVPTHGALAAQEFDDSVLVLPSAFGGVSVMTFATNESFFTVELTRVVLSTRTGKLNMSKASSVPTVCWV